MKFGSDCKGVCFECELFYHKASCLAGHGDDHFVPLTVDRARELLAETSQPKGNKRYLKEFILRCMGGDGANEYDELKLTRRKLITEHELELAQLDGLIESRLNELVRTSDSAWTSIKTRIKSLAGEVK